MWNGQCANVVNQMPANTQKIMNIIVFNPYNINHLQTLQRSKKNFFK